MFVSYQQVKSDKSNDFEKKKFESKFYNMPLSKKKTLQPDRPVSLSSVENIQCIDKIGYIYKKTKKQIMEVE